MRKRKHAAGRRKVIRLRARGTPTSGAGPIVRLDLHRLVILATVVYFVYAFVAQQLVFLDLQQQLADIESRMNSLRAERTALQERAAYLRSDAYVVTEARRRFGLAPPGEVQYLILDDPAPPDTGEPPEPGDDP